jgi:hypothetical protein
MHVNNLDNGDDKIKDSIFNTHQLDSNIRSFDSNTFNVMKLTGKNIKNVLKLSEEHFNEMREKCPSRGALDRSLCWANTEECEYEECPHVYWSTKSY